MLKTQKHILICTVIWLLTSSCAVKLKDVGSKAGAVTTATATPVPDPVTAVYHLRNTRSGLEFKVKLNKTGNVYYAIYNADPGTLTAAAAKLAATGPIVSPVVAAGTVAIGVANSDIYLSLNGLAEKKVYWMVAVAESTAAGLDRDADVMKYSKILPKGMTQLNFNKVTGPSTGTLVRYAASVPQDYYDNPSATYPILIWIHGNGESFNDATNAESNFTNAAQFLGPFKRLANDLNNIPMIVIAAQCNYAFFSCASQADPSLHKEAYDNALTRFRVNTKRVYVMGLSYGGQGTFHFANAYPTLVAAAVPMACANPLSSAAICTSLGSNNVPVWGIVDRADSIFGSTSLTQTISDLRACANYTNPRARARLTVFAAGSWPNTVENHGSAENLGLELPFYWGGIWQYWNGSAQVADTNPPTHPAALGPELVAANPGNTLDAPIIAMDSFPTASASLGVPITNIYDWMMQFSKP